MRLRKPCRVSRPKRVTQRGSRRHYPRSDRRAEALLRDRWAGYDRREVQAPDLRNQAQTLV